MPIFKILIDCLVREEVMGKHFTLSTAALDMEYGTEGFSETDDLRSSESLSRKQ